VQLRVLRLEVDHGPRVPWKEGRYLAHVSICLGSCSSVFAPPDALDGLKLRASALVAFTLVFGFFRLWLVCGFSGAVSTRVGAMAARWPLRSVCFDAVAELYHNRRTGDGA